MLIDTKNLWACGCTAICPVTGITIEVFMLKAVNKSEAIGKCHKIMSTMYPNDKYTYNIVSIEENGIIDKSFKIKNTDKSYLFD